MPLFTSWINFESLSLPWCNCPPFHKKKIYGKSDLRLWAPMTAKEKCRIYCLLLQPDFRSNCCGTWRWVSSYKPVLHINYLIRRSQWLYKLSHSFVFNGLCVHIKPQRPSYTSQERGLLFTELGGKWMTFCMLNQLWNVHLIIPRNPPGLFVLQHRFTFPNIPHINHYFITPSNWQEA